MKIIPELNYWIYQRYFEGPINEYPFEFPTEMNKSKWCSDNSVLNLLFNETFNEDSYQILYKQISFQNLNDIILTTRLVQFRNDIQIYKCSRGSVLPYPPPTTPCSLPNENGENIFEFDEEEINLLNILFDYRSTGYDTSSQLDVIIFDDLNSSLSKLIYIYLQLSIYDNFDIYDNSLTYSNQNRLIELLFEKYVIDTYFRLLQKSYLVLDSTTTLKTIELQTIDEVITVNNIYFNAQRAPLQYTPFELEDFTLIVNGEVKKIVFDYDVYVHNDIPYLSWEDLELQVNVNDKLYVCYSYEI